MSNIIFKISKGEKYEKKFIDDAKEIGLIELQGHRLLGGLRASIYNAITIEEVEKLVKFMINFVNKNG